MAQKVDGLVPKLVVGLRTVVMKQNPNKMCLYAKLLGPAFVESCSVQLAIVNDDGTELEGPEVGLTPHSWAHIVCHTRTAL